jgi:hypothetical protein
MVRRANFQASYWRTITEEATTNVILFDGIKVKRRYTRSVNLERDLEISDSVNGYIITPKVEGLINRFIDSIMQPNAVRAWTITGAYGTGKSAFAHFLSAISSSRDQEIRKNAYKILKTADVNIQKISRAIPETGLMRAVVTAQREPIANTLVRGLKYGADRFYSNARGQKSQLRLRLDEVYHRALRGDVIPGELVIRLLIDFGKHSKSGIIIIVDELGKNLEYCSQNQATADLYLLQQIAELPSGASNPKMFFLGLLHQAFYDYSHSLASSQRNEWMKIQGRFEDIPFTESPARLVHLIAGAIDQTGLDVSIRRQIGDWARSWKAELSTLELGRINISDIGHVYPFHPLCALALPILCNKFSQNDRTLFTYLAGDEPQSFKAFLKNTEFNGKLPTVKVKDLYDFFIESAAIAITSRSQHQIWIEIQSRISELSNLDGDSLDAVKTIGILNLISNMGTLKASPKTVALSLCDDPASNETMQYWFKVIEDLSSKGIIRYVSTIDSLRIWEGTDFDIEKELAEEIDRVNLNLTNVLNNLAPLKPLVARRHSYVTGTTRLFERYYVDSITENIGCNRIDSDGVIVYMVGKHSSKKSVQAYIEDGKPVVIICAADTKALRHAANEYAALQNISESRKELTSDGVARKEVRHRLYIAEEILRTHIEKSFDVTRSSCYITGHMERFANDAAFNARLSDLCKEVYSGGPTLWNELINKRELTSQGAKARRELIEAMLNNVEAEQLGLSGHGPERSMYDSLLLNTGVHRFDGEKWEFGSPTRDSGIYQVWLAIENFCKSATKTPQSVDALYTLLQKPPYGMKQGAIPVLLLAVFMQQSDYLSVYYNGSYIPVLGTEHFELLTKKPSLFSVKYLEVSGLRIKLFEELGEIVSSSSIKNNKKVRNTTLLSIINPLVKFVQRLPKYTRETDNLSPEAKAVRNALLNAKDPEELLLRALPQACGYSFIDFQSGQDDSVVKSFRKKLVIALQELQAAYDSRLSQNKRLFGDAFSVRKDSENLREYLRAIASRVNSQTAVIELNLKRFIQALMNRDLEDRAWLEAVSMVIADKPVESWSDRDSLAFEIKLGEIAKRFKNVEALIELTPDVNKGFEARKVTITHQDGREFSEVLWIDKDEKNKIHAETREIKDKHFTDNDKMNKALLAALIETVLSSAEEEEKEEKSKEYGR